MKLLTGKRDSLAPPDPAPPSPAINMIPALAYKNKTNAPDLI